MEQESTGVKWFHSLKFRMALGIVLFLALSMGLALYWANQGQKEALIDGMRRQVHQTGEIVKAGIKFQMLKENKEFTQEVLEEMQRNGAVQKIAVINKMGKITHSSQKGEVGRVIVDKRDDACIMCHQDSLLPQSQTVISGTSFRHVNPIQNEPRCNGCHSAKERLLGIVLLEKPMGEIGEVIRSVRDRLLLVSLSSLLVVIGIISLVTGRWVHKPVEQLVQGTKEVGAGDLNARVKVSGKGEFSVLANSFNSMTENLAGSLNEIRLKNVELDLLYTILERISKTINFVELRKIIMAILSDTFETAETLIVSRLWDGEGYEIVFQQRDAEGPEKFVYVEGYKGDVPAWLPRETLERWIRGEIEEGEVSEDGLKAVLPLSVRENRLGLIVAVRAPSNPFDPQDARVLSALGDHVAMAFEHSRLYTMAITDELTKLYTLRYFREQMEEQVSRFNRFGHTFSLLMLDLDRFKEVNDLYGHEAGNIVLRKVATIVSGCIREVDTACRYGGEEFTIILPETRASSARMVAERIRRETEETAIDLDGQGVVNITVSIGTSSCPQDGRDMEELIRLADESMYKAKRMSRNRVCSSSNSA